MFCWLLACATYRIVQLDYASFKGIAHRNYVTYYNVPYAQPPVGDLRFRHPQPPLNTSHLIDCTTQGPSCMLDTSEQINLFARPSEDCLGMNIVTPMNGSNLPVFVYVHGGKFTSGYNSFPYTFGAQNMIRDGNQVVVVAINYRLGAFGFLPSEELEAEGSLNAGVVDVAFAFQWIRKYIHKFGGNPNMVTAFGQSAGGIIISSLLLANDGKLNLFDRAFVMSGAAMPIIDIPKSVSFVTNEVAQRAGCNTTAPLHCLRSLDADDLLKASIGANFVLNSPYTSSFAPVIDNKYFVRQAQESLDRGLIRRIPLMISTVKDEGEMAFTYSGLSPQEYERRLFVFMNEEELVKLGQLYPPVHHDKPYKNLTNAISDWAVNCPSERLAFTYMRHGQTVHFVRFNYKGSMLSKLDPEAGVLHGSDLPFWFQFVWLMAPFGKERKLARIMMEAMVNFGTCPDPKHCDIGGSEDTLPWPEYRDGSIVLDTPVSKLSIAQTPDAELRVKCDYFDQVLKSKKKPIQRMPYAPTGIEREELELKLRKRSEPVQDTPVYSYIRSTSAFLNRLLFT